MANIAVLTSSHNDIVPFIKFNVFGKKLAIPEKIGLDWSIEC